MIWVALTGLGLLFLGVPVAFALGLAGLVGVWIADIPFAIVATRIFAGVDSFVFLAVPFYILAAEIMSQGGITARLISITRHATTWLRGGTAFSNIGASIIFAGISGSAVADAAALGRVYIEEMPKEGYTKSYAAAVTVASSIIGPIIPPSGLAIILGAVAGISVVDLFLAGVIPGLLLGGACASVVAIDALRGRIPRPTPAPTGELVLQMIVSGIAVATLPVIIVGGMVIGAYTATEGGGVAVAYAIFLATVVFRELDLAGLWRAFMKAARISATIYLLVAAATVLSYALNLLGVSSWVTRRRGHVRGAADPVPLRHRAADAGARHLPRHRRRDPDLHPAPDARRARARHRPAAGQHGGHADAGHRPGHAARGRRAVRGHAHRPDRDVPADAGADAVPDRRARRRGASSASCPASPPGFPTC